MLPRSRKLSSCDCSNNKKWFLAGGDRLGERVIGRVVREVLFAGEKAEEGTALLRDVVADGAAQHGIAGFECVQHRALRSSLLLQEANLGDVRRQMARTTQS
jgi:hypothetical protein